MGNTMKDIKKKKIKIKFYRCLWENCVRSNLTPLTFVERFWRLLGAEVVRSIKPFPAVSHVAEMIKITASQIPNLGTKIRKWDQDRKVTCRVVYLGEQETRKREMKVGWKRASLGKWGEERTKGTCLV